MSSSDEEFELGSAGARDTQRWSSAPANTSNTNLRALLSTSTSLEKPASKTSFLSVANPSMRSSSTAAAGSSSSRVQVHTLPASTSVWPAPLSSLPTSSKAVGIAPAISFSGVHHKQSTAAATVTRPTFSSTPSSFASSSESDNSGLFSSAPSSPRIQAMLERLNPQQCDAVLYRAAPLLIVASAGSGKTLTLTTRLLRFLDEGVAPSNFLALTFTVKAAEEMRNRIERALGYLKASALHICNFHSLALRILRDHWVACRAKQQFQVLSLVEQRKLIKECAVRVMESRAAKGGRGGVAKFAQKLAAEHVEAEEERLGALMAAVQQADKQGGNALGGGAGMYSSYSSSATEAQGSDLVSAEVLNYFVSFIRGAKSKNKRPTDYADEHREIFNMYVMRCQEKSLIDFADMIPMVIDLLKRRPDILQQYRALYRFVMVDEYQDIDAGQFELLMLIAREHGNVTVCGDDDQSIYGWRGSSVRSFDMFSHAFPQQRSVVLTQTYRSTQRICRAVTALIDVNVDRTKKTMWTANEKGEPVHVIVSQHASGEIDTIVAAIQKLRRPHPPASATSSSSSPSSSSSSASSLSSANAIGPPAVRWSQICVLARTRRVLTSFESVFKKAGFPMFSTVNHSSAAAKRLNVHKARELVDVLAYCDLICSVDGGSAGSSGILDRAAVDDAAGEQQRADAAFRRVYNTPKRSLNEEVLREIESQARMRKLSLLSSARLCCDDAHRSLSAKHKARVAAFLDLIVRMRIECGPLLRSVRHHGAGDGSSVSDGEPSAAVSFASASAVALRGSNAASGLSEHVNSGESDNGAEASGGGVRAALAHVLDSIGYRAHLGEEGAAARLGNIDLLLERAAEFDVEQEDFFHQARRAQQKPSAAVALRAGSDTAERESSSSSSSSSSSVSAASPHVRSSHSVAALSAVALAAALRPLAAFVAELRDADANADTDRAKSEVPDVIFMSTIHAAKGLEFDYVFVVRFNEGIMPLTARGSSTMEGDEPAKSDPASMSKGVVLDEVALQLEEERRLAYVACSRAKVQLNLSFILTDSNGAACQPSRFLNEMPSDAMSEATATASTTALAAGASGGAACEYMRLLAGAAGAGKAMATGGGDGGSGAAFRAPNSTAASAAAFTTPRPKVVTAVTSAAATMAATTSPAESAVTSASPCPTMSTSAASPQQPLSAQAAAATGNVTPFRSPFATPKLAAASTSISSTFPSSSTAASTAAQVTVAAAAATADAAIAASDRHANALLLAGRQRFRPLTASVPPVPHTANSTQSLADTPKSAHGASVTAPLSLSVQKPPRVPAQQLLQSQATVKPTEGTSASRIDESSKNFEDEDFDDASLTTTVVKHGLNADSAANEWASVASQASHVMFRPRIALLPGAVSSFASSTSSSFASSASGLGFASKPFVGLAAMMNAGAGGAFAPAAAASPSSSSTVSSDAASPSSLKRAAPPTAGGVDASSPDAKRAAVSSARTPTTAATPLPRSILLSGPRMKPMHM